MERVFHEMGIGSPRNLHEFYQNRIVRYHEHLLQVYQRLQDDYSRILNQINNGSELVIYCKCNTPMFAMISACNNTFVIQF
jgi:hypothetical protein